MAQPDRLTIGGTKTAAFYSGQVAPALTGVTGGVAVGSDVLFWSGQGRLDAVSLHNVLQSGTNVVFYDAPAPISGGPLASSGHIPLAFIPGNPAATAASGATGGAYQYGTMIQFGTPFFNGLCLNSRSGQVGFTVQFSSEKPTG